MSKNPNKIINWKINAVHFFFVQFTWIIQIFSSKQKLIFYCVRFLIYTLSFTKMMERVGNFYLQSFHVNMVFGNIFRKFSLTRLCESLEKISLRIIKSRFFSLFYFLWAKYNLLIILKCFLNNLDLFKSNLATNHTNLRVHDFF